MMDNNRNDRSGSGMDSEKGQNQSDNRGDRSNAGSDRSDNK